MSLTLLFAQPGRHSRRRQPRVSDTHRPRTAGAGRLPLRHEPTDSRPLPVARGADRVGGSHLHPAGDHDRQQDEGDCRPRGQHLAQQVAVENPSVHAARVTDRPPPSVADACRTRAAGAVCCAGPVERKAKSRTWFTVGKAMKNWNQSRKSLESAACFAISKNNPI